MDATLTKEESRPAAEQWSVSNFILGLLGPTARKGLVSIADQGVVSATSFATTLLVGRLTGADGLGLYTLAFTYVFAVVTLQSSFILFPFTVHYPKSACQTSLASATLRRQIVLMALATVIPFAAAVVLWTTGRNSAAASMAFALAISVPFHSLRQFARKLLLSEMRVIRLFLLDAAVSLLQLGLLLAVELTVGLSPALALGCIAFACGVGSAVWLYVCRSQFSLLWKKRQPGIEGNYRRLSMWIFACLASAELGKHAMFWILAWYNDAETTGLFAAAMSAVLLFNPILLGFNNIFAPRAARAMAEQGVSELRRVVLKCSILLSSAQALFCVVIILFDSDLIQFFYGAEYTDYGWTITLLACAAFVSTLGVAPGDGLWVLERSDLSFWSALPGIVLQLVLLTVLVPVFGLAGAAGAMLLGHLVVSSGLWWTFHRVSRPSPTLDISGGDA